jgi:ABC-type lipoprotein export system ATPase subunit
VTPAIDLRDVFRIFSTPEGDAAALQGLTLAVAGREVVTVLGPSGSGKTTLLRVLAGLDRPSAGTATVLGQNLGKLSASGLAVYRARVLGYADQHYQRALFPELSARDNVGVRLAFDGRTQRERLARADELLERVGLADKRDAFPRELSGGEQQRVAVCAAIAHRPPLFLADEPTGELDAANARAIFALIGDLARAHDCTTVVVSHDPTAAAIADRAVHIRDGRVSEEHAGSFGSDGAIVVGRGGWLRLPEELLRRAGISTHAVAHLEGDRVVVAPALGTQVVETDGKPEPVRPAEGEGRVVAETVGLTRRYGEGRSVRTVVDGLDARFAGGRMHAVTGPSGSGKTTLLHLLAGLDLPDDGEVRVLGTVVSALDRETRAALRRERIALVGQQPGLVAFLSARENVELGLALRGRSAGDDAVEALAAVGLAERAEQRVERLSGGERLRVAIARAVAARPALLLADEPTARLDQANALAIGTLLARLAAEHDLAVVCASHDPLVIEQAASELALDR